MYQLRTLLVCLCLATPLFSSTSFFPLRDVKPGLKGTGRTVFQGDRVEEFQVEILGVLENSGPKQSIILARLSGGPLANAGVMQGMSGSPVYVEGKLLGAIALGFPFSKEPIAGIQPIEQMVRGQEGAVTSAEAHITFPELAKQWRQRFQPDPASGSNGSNSELRNLSTPLVLGGFTESTVQRFSQAFRKLGFEPQTGAGAGSRSSQPYTGTVEPGAMIAVQLMSGDLNVSADGTVTHVDGKKVYAFGHRFLASGTTDLPFARADVITLLPNLNSSFKVSAARELVGSITSDLSTAVSGEIGRPARLIPLDIQVHGPDGPHTYNIDLVNDRLFTPFLAQMALYSTIDGTERTTGAGTLRVRGKVEFEGDTPPLVLDNVFAADSNAALAATFNLITPLAFSLQAGFANMTLKRLSFQFDIDEQKRQLEIQDAWLSRTEVRPGDTVNITCLLAGENGFEIKKSLPYTIPIGASTGKLFLTISDGNMLNFSELAGLSPTSLSSARQLVDILNSIRPNDQAYVRIWRQEPSFSLPGADLTDPPPSVAVVLSKTSSAMAAGGNPLISRGSQMDELRIAFGDYAVTGSKTIQLDIKE